MSEHYTIEDLYRATNVPLGVLRAWVRGGRLKPMPTTRRERAYSFDATTLEKAKELGHAWHLLRSPQVCEAAS